ncbi:MAG: hypothetical protein IJ501_00480 [Bacilli bacterium]|nr:hypothetical protein [Bacilli bacterium]
MKNKILLITTILLLASACSSNNLKKLSFEKLNEKLENKDSFVLYLTNEDEYGTTLKNTLTSVSKENDLKTFYVNLDKLSDSELDSLNEKFTFEDENIILFIKDGSESTVLSRVDDPYISHDKLTNELKNQGFIK